MNSDPEHCSKINDSEGAEMIVEVNDEVNPLQENGKYLTDLADDSSPLEGNVGGKSKSGASCEDPVSAIKFITGESNQDGQRKELVCEEVYSTQSIQKEEIADQAKVGVNSVSALGKDGKPVVQRRMSLRYRTASEKYAKADRSSDDDLKEPLVSAKDRLKIPVTRPPPELIKAPILSKISIASASVTVVPRSKENHSSSGFVVVDTQSILKGKNAAPVSNVPLSMTVSAIPPMPKVMPKPISSPVSSSANRKRTNASSSNCTSLLDPFESLFCAGLADDSFIVEAPSFVVPYLIEKSASENLKKTVQSMVPPPPTEKKEDVRVLSEEGSSNSEKIEKDEVISTSATAVCGGSLLDKSTMKSKMEKSVAQSEKAKEEDNYFTQPIGRFFLDIGVSLVQEYVLGDLLRVQQRKVHKGTKITDASLSVNALTKGLEATCTKNDPYRLPLRTCDRCSFQSESSLMMAHHWSLPLALGSGSFARYGCHWCCFEAKESHMVSSHIETEHGMKSWPRPDLPSHQCPLCPFENSVKFKVTRHMMSCQKRFIADRNLGPPLEWEPPAKISRVPTEGLRAFTPGINAGTVFHGDFPSTETGQNTYLDKMTSAVQAKRRKRGNPSQATLAGLRLPAELPGVCGASQRATATSAPQPKVRDYRQQASYQSSPDLNPSSCGVQIIRVGNLGESNEATLRRLFNSFGEIWWLKICPLRKPFGIRAALVKFRNPGDAEKAMACRDECVIGKLEITRADPNHLWEEFLPIGTLP